MTRKKQGAPQKLNAIEDNNSDTDAPKQASTNQKQSANLTADDLTDTAKTNSSIDSEILDKIAMDSSCEKLLAFTKSFLPPANQNNESMYDSDYSAKRNEERKWISPDESGRLSKSPTLAKSFLLAQENNKYSSDELELLAKSIRMLASKENLPTTGIEDKGDVMPASEAESALLSDMDLSQLSATQKFFVDAMLRQQRQYYEQCSNNWMNVQRSDNNCLSKSKAERYRWCVQGGSETSNSHKSSRPAVNGQSNHIHNSPKKLNSNHSNNETASAQEKLFSQVFNGASKFHCRDCRKSFNTLVDLTVHMNQTGHFRDTNDEKNKASDSETTLPTSNESFSPSNISKKKRAALEDEQQSEKVLTCMGCGNLFESLQDLSVHMIKTKHYENVPALRMWTQKQDAEGNLPLPESESRKRAGSGGVQKKFPDHGSQPATSLAGSPPFFFPNAPGSDIFGLTNPANTAYASLLYSAPWLASTFLPQLLYPYGFPPAYPPSLVPMATEEKTESGKTSCTECNREFASLAQLADHIRKTRHYPAAFGDVTGSSTPPDNRHIVANAKRPSVDRSKYRQSKDNVASTYSFGGHSPTLPNAKPYIQPPTAKNDRKGGKTFDFIKSLESTIQSAISKVESPHSNSTLSHNSTKLHQANAFSPFSSSIKSEKNSFDLANRFCTAGKNKRYPDAKVSPSGHKRSKTPQADADRPFPGKRTNGFHSPTAAKNKRNESNESPLDLTVKTRQKSVDSTPETPPPTTLKECPNRETSEVSKPVQSNPFAAYSGSKPSKDPLQSLKENMQSFLSLVGGDGRHSNPSTMPNPPSAKDRDRLSDYRPLMIDSSPTSDPKSSNPLREMLKIVNNADLEKKRPSALLRPDTSSRKRSTEERIRENTKKAKFSLLRDLVIPKEDSSSLNPLQKLQDLVAWNASPSPPDQRSSNPSNDDVTKIDSRRDLKLLPKKDSETISGCELPSRSPEINAASSLLSLKQSRRHAIGDVTSSESRVFAEEGLRDLSEELAASQQIQLQLVVLENFQEDSESTFEVRQSDLERIVKLTSLKAATINDWIHNQKILFNQRSSLSFFRRHGDQQNEPITFQCTLCRQQVRHSGVESFITHLRKHLEYGDYGTIGTCDSSDSNDVTRTLKTNGHTSPFDGEKHEYPSSTHYRSQHISCAEDSLRSLSENHPNLDEVAVATPPPSDENLDDESDVLEKVRHHARARPVADDVIGVTG